MKTPQASPQNSRLEVLSGALGQLLVARNPRGMATLCAALAPTNYLHAAQHLLGAHNNVLIVTGFPVGDTFETDGPAGALALYRFLETRDVQPWIMAGESLLQALGSATRGRALQAFAYADAQREATALLAELAPTLIIVIERPGAAADGCYYNIAGKDISAACRPAEPYIEQATCPVIAIGDGGNELGMGKAGSVLTTLNIQPAVTGCDELLVADVSNWGAYGLIAMAEYLLGQSPVLDWLDPQALLEQLVASGAVDGVTHASQATEDGLPIGAGDRLRTDLQSLFSQYIDEATRS